MIIGNIYRNYELAEKMLINQILVDPDFITSTMYEKIGAQFTILNPTDNKNKRSNYEYAEAFFRWLLQGKDELTDELVRINPWVKRFVDTTGLPDNFSSSYASKIMSQINGVMDEITFHGDSRRGYLNILYPTDSIIRTAKTTHEYPCTIGFQFLVRNNQLHMIVNMRSNNVYKVMPYDVYNFTELQKYVSDKLSIPIGMYIHQINSAHIFKGDARRIREEQNKLSNL